MDFLEAWRLVVVDGGHVPLVPGPHLGPGVLDHNVGDLKQPEGQCHASVGLNRLQEPLQQRRPRYLEFQCLWVGDVDSGYILDLLSHLCSYIIS